MVERYLQADSFIDIHRIIGTRNVYKSMNQIQII